MSLKREWVSLRSGQSRDMFQVQVEYTVRDGRMVLTTLHSELKGTFARVYKARVGQGGVWMPAAFKVQRDQAQSRDGWDQVAGKFACEFYYHRWLQEGEDGETLDVRPVVKLLDLGSQAGVDQGGSSCDRLPPTILCRHARHGLKPLCPIDGSPLEEDEWITGEDERRLLCPECHGKYLLADKQEVLRASIDRDPSACRGCVFHKQNDPEPCLKSALFLNFFTSRVLVFELLDEDLSDFLNRQGLSEEVELLHGGKAGALPEAWHRLRLILDLFSKVLEGVQCLRRKGIAHLDLKPPNICVRKGALGMEAKVIDLGSAIGGEAPDLVRQTMGINALSHDFAVSEVSQPFDELRAVRCWRQRHWARLDIRHPRSRDEADPLVCVGDRMTLAVPGEPHESYVVERVMEGDSRLEVTCLAETAVAEESGADLRHLEFHGESVVCEARLRKARGSQADMFSLGLNLLALLIEDVDVSDYLQVLSNLQTAIERQEEIERHRGRGLIRSLVELRDDFLKRFYRIEEHLDAFEDLRFLAEELLAIVIKATLRGEPFYLSHRSGDAEKAFDRLEEDLGMVRSSLEVFERYYVCERWAEVQRRGLGEIRNWLVPDVEGEQGLTLATGPRIGEAQLIEALCGILDKNGEVTVGEIAPSSEALLARYDGDRRQLAGRLDRVLGERSAGIKAAHVPEKALIRFYELRRTGLVLKRARDDVELMMQDKEIFRVKARGLSPQMKGALSSCEEIQALIEKVAALISPGGFVSETDFQDRAIPVTITRSVRKDIEVESPGHYLDAVDSVITRYERTVARVDEEVVSSLAELSLFSEELRTAMRRTVSQFESRWLKHKEEHFGQCQSAREASRGFVEFLDVLQRRVLEPCDARLGSSSGILIWKKPNELAQFSVDATTGLILSSKAIFESVAKMRRALLYYLAFERSLEAAGLSGEGEGDSPEE